jgi:hypothetical protein
VASTTDDGAATAALATLVRMIARAVVAELKAADSHSDMVDQTRSPLSAKKHCAIVRARIARGAGGAAIAGRKHLITREALQEELAALTARGSRKHRATQAPSVAAVDNDLDVYLARYGVKKAG